MLRMKPWWIAAPISVAVIDFAMEHPRNIDSTYSDYFAPERDYNDRSRPLVQRTAEAGNLVVCDAAERDHFRVHAGFLKLLNSRLVRGLLIAVLEKADSGLAQFTGKAFDRKPGPEEETCVQNRVEAGQTTPGQEAARGVVSLVRRTAP